LAAVEFRDRFNPRMARVLIPTDFSDNAKRAERYALMLFGPSSHYTLLSTFEVPHSGATMLISITDILQRDSLELLNDEMVSLEHEFPDVVDRITVHTEAGVPDLVVEKLSRLGRCDVVVMGTRGASGIKAALVGSNTSATVQRSHCPVLAVPDKASLKAPARILFAADNISLNKPDLPPMLLDVAREWDSEVILLNVVKESDLNRVGVAPGVSTEPLNYYEGVRHSYRFISAEDPEEGIERFLRDNEVDMICMVNRKTDLVSRLFNRSISNRLVLHTEIPLLIIHQKDIEP
jgi:nucleotide-binding universal stress UspA family protein